MSGQLKRVDMVGVLAARMANSARARPMPAASTLDLAGKLFQPSIYPHARQVAMGGRLAAPLVVDLDPTTFCDLACPECISMNVLNQGQFSSERLLALADELAQAKVQGVILIGGGEPLMHRAIDRVIEILHQAGVRIGIVTNGTMIDRHFDALSNMLSWVRVSVDAATEATYDKFRPSGRSHSVFPKVIENMRLLARHKAGNLGYSFLLMQAFDDAGRLLKSNFDEVYAAGELARDIGCDYFEIKSMLDDNHRIVGRAAADIALVDQQVAALRALETPSFKVLAASTWQGLHDEHQGQNKAYRRCGVAELRTTITPSGVYACAYHRGNDKAKVGDLSAMSLDAMWAQADTGRVDPSRDCDFHCARHGSNLALAAIASGDQLALLGQDYDPFI